ncbi:hypothetical protein F5H01DRAFT_364871 [Linnemannia elongata]|nr:hypothetical protein F5H01DRAFT_364871 [Linnemannia elongata]
MSDRGGPYALARSRAGSESYQDPSGRSGRSGIDKSDKCDYGDSGNRGHSYDIRHLFNILLIAFSSVPTTILLAWIISWSIVMVYLCTFGFAIGVACILGLSMFIYGPIFCFCVISAFGCSLVYNVSRFGWDTTWRAWYTVRRVLYNLLAGPSLPTNGGMKGVVAHEESTGWFSWLLGWGDMSNGQNEGTLGWGTLGAPAKEPEWGTQPLEEKFETRPATTSTLPSGPVAGGGGGGARGRFPPAIPGTGTSGALASTGIGMGGHGGRKGSVRGEEVVHPYHVRGK